MRLRRGYGSEQGPDLQAVVHVVRDVGMTAAEAARACGAASESGRFVWYLKCDRRGLEWETRRHAMETKAEDKAKVRWRHVKRVRRGRHVVEIGQFRSCSACTPYNGNEADEDDRHDENEAKSQCKQGRGDGGAREERRGRCDAQIL